MFDLHGYLPFILDGMVLTVLVAVCALALSVVIGIFGAVAKLSNSAIARAVAGIYTTIIRALPAYGNEVIFLLHGSVVAGVITIVDLFGAAKIVNSRHFVPFESFIAAGLFYLCVTFAIVWIFKQWERRWHAHLRPREEG